MIFILMLRWLINLSCRCSVDVLGLAGSSSMRLAGVPSVLMFVVVRINLRRAWMTWAILCGAIPVVMLIVALVLTVVLCLVVGMICFLVPSIIPSATMMTLLVFILMSLLGYMIVVRFLVSIWVRPALLAILGRLAIFIIRSVVGVVEVVAGVSGVGAVLGTLDA